MCDTVENLVDEMKSNLKYFLYSADQLVKELSINGESHFTKRFQSGELVSLREALDLVDKRLDVDIGLNDRALFLINLSELVRAGFGTTKPVDQHGRGDREENIPIEPKESGSSGFDPDGIKFELSKCPGCNHIRYHMKP